MERKSFKTVGLIIVISTCVTALIQSSLVLSINEFVGWTEITKDWPLEEQEFYIATSKGHHYIEIKLPNLSKLTRDLELEFEFYYSYKRTKPILNLVPCKTNVEVLGRTTFGSAQFEPNTWVQHSKVIGLEDCIVNPELTYDIILHDEGDVFAWKKIKLQSVGYKPELNVEPVPKPTDLTDKPTIDPPNEKKDPPEPTKDKNDIKTDSNIVKRSTEEQAEILHPLLRFKRSDDEAKKDISLTCRPRSCNREVFNSPRFMVFTSSLPPADKRMLSSGTKYYLDTSMKPLELRLESIGDPTSVDICFDMQLYMDPGTELDIQLKDSKKKKDSVKLLETIQKKSGESTAGKWDELKRCMSDYVPHIPTTTGQETSGDRALNLEFVPHYDDPAARIGVLFDEKKAFRESILHPTLDFIPNDLTNFQRYWTLDRDGVEKAKTSLITGDDLRLKIIDIDPTQTSFDVTSRWMKIDDIEILKNPVVFFYHADKPDWIESIDFEYQRAGLPVKSWISKTVYQAPTTTAGSDVTESQSEQNPGSSDPSKTNPTAIDPKSKESPKKSESPETALDRPLKSEIKDELLVPFKIKLTSDEFRIRVRHHLKQSSKPPLELVMDSLAFGDACAEGDYCKNGGVCKPHGPSTASCICREGYSGNHCEIVKPCEVYYGGQTGSQLCKSMGAMCVDELPVLRCRWPDDQYYECRVLFKSSKNSEGNTNIVPVSPSGESIDDLPLPDQVSAWKERYNKQSQTIIIMVVFLIAILLFSAVIVGNMILRLMKSKKKLKTAENEMHDLSYRMQPSTSAPSRVPGKLSGALSYNNQAFDVE